MSDLFGMGIEAAKRHMGDHDPLEFFKRAAEVVEYAAAAKVTGPAADARPGHMLYWAGAAAYAANKTGDPQTIAHAAKLTKMAARARP